MTVRIVLADDHVIVRDGLRSLLEQQAGMEIVAEATTGLEAVQLTSKTKPDVVVLDASMPILNGVEAARQIHSQCPGVRIVCLTMHAENKFVSAMLEAGVSAYLLKECASEELVRAIETVLTNQVYISPGVGQVVADHFKAGGTHVGASAFSTLTDKERTVLQMLAEGHSTREIGERLNLSAKTVASHREHLMKKLDIPSIAGLTKLAIQVGLISLES